MESRWTEPTRLRFGVAALSLTAVAALLRLVRLDANPLSAVEAGNAGFAWALAGANPDLPIDRLRAAEPSALLQGVHWWVAWFGLDGDFAARLPGALAGVALALLPLAFRETVGARRSWLLATLLAIDPILVGVSRRDAGLALGLLLGCLALLLGAPGSRDGAREGPRFRHSGSIAIGLLLATGFAAWAFLPWLLLAALFGEAWRGPGGFGRSELRPVVMPLHGSTVVLSLILASSAGLFAWPLLPGVSSSLTSFLDHLRSGCAELSASPSIASLVRVEAVLIAAGLAALGWWSVRAVRNRCPMGKALLMATVWGAFLAGTTRGATESLAFVVLPLVAAIAFAVPENGPRRRRGLLTALGGAALAVSSLGAVRSVAGPGERFVDRLFPPSSDPQARQLRAELLGVGAEMVPGAPGERLAVQLPPWPDPVVAWYLRGVEVAWIEGPAAAARFGRATAVLTSASSLPAPWLVPPRAGAVPVGRPFRLRTALPRISRDGVQALDSVVLWRFVGGAEP